MKKLITLIALITTIATAKAQDYLDYSDQTYVNDRVAECEAYYTRTHSDTFLAQCISKCSYYNKYYAKKSASVIEQLMDDYQWYSRTQGRYTSDIAYIECLVEARQRLDEIIKGMKMHCARKEWATNKLMEE